MASFFSSVVVQWWVRRFIELGPWVGGALSWFLSQSPEVQGVILGILQGNWQTISLGTIVSIAGYVWSYVSTRRNQVTIDGKQVPFKDLEQTPQKTAVEEIARTAISNRKTGLNVILEQLNKLGKR